MINISRWRASIGLFNSRVNSGYVDRDYSSSASDVLLHTGVTVIRDITVLQMFMHVYVVSVLLLLLCGDIEMNPGPVYIFCPDCNIQVHIRKKICECGYVLRNKGGRKMGTTCFSGTAGRPPSNVDIELNVPIGRPNSNDDIELNVPIGRPNSNDDVELDVQLDVQLPMMILSLMYQLDVQILMMMLSLMYQLDVQLPMMMLSLMYQLDVQLPMMMLSLMYQLDVLTVQLMTVLAYQLMKL